MIQIIKFVKFVIVFSIFCSYAYADKIFVSSDGGTIIAAISKREITRIAFEKEIVSINSIKGELEYDIQGKDVYIRSLVIKPTNFFVTLDENITYKFLVTAEDIPATQLFIESNLAEVLDLTKTEQQKTKEPQKISFAEYISEDLKTRIAKIIEVTLKPRKYLGYSLYKLNKSLSAPSKNLSMQLVDKITGNKLIAEKIYVTNKSKFIQNLNLSEFTSNDVLAVYLSKETLLPLEASVLIRIIED